MIDPWYLLPAFTGGMWFGLWLDRQLTRFGSVKPVEDLPLK